MSNSIECILDATSWQQAQALADKLLATGLAARVEFLEVKDGQWRRQADHHIRAVKLIVTTTLAQQAAVLRLAAAASTPRTNVLDLPAAAIKQWLGTVVTGRLSLAS